MARGARHLDTAAARGDGESVTRRGVNDAAAPGPKDEQGKSKPESGTPDKKTEEIISKAGKTQGAKRPAEEAGFTGPFFKFVYERSGSCEHSRASACVS